jgi:hypothetical protein
VWFVTFVVKKGRLSPLPCAFFAVAVKNYRKGANGKKGNKNLAPLLLPYSPSRLKTTAKAQKANKGIKIVPPFFRLLRRRG